MTVRQLETQMEARELQEWMAFFAMEPWGAVRADYRSGVVAATLVNVNGGKKGKKPAQADDFFNLYTKHSNRKQTNQQQISIMQKIAAVQNG
jgi:hypothetical protein|tara:strand:- start:130 stop:405 length:276 start_codon:yes stop_codon:yes gene_type:complete